jgi:peptidyl-prolyl cis-trans isomerase D
MLDLMRRKKRLKAILWVVIIGLGMGMLLFFVPGQNLGGGGTTAGVVATVDGDPITVKEFWDTYRRALQNVSRNSNSQLDPELLKQLGLDRQALDSLINVRVISYAAKRLGLSVTPEELRRTLETNPNFQVGGSFIGAERYRALLAANQLDVGEFEDGLRMSMLAGKVRGLITDSLVIPEDDIRREYLRSEQEAQVRFALLKKEDYRKRVLPTEADLKAYFEANKAKYAIDEERRARYLLIAIPGLASTIEVTDKEVEDQWAKEARRETVDASHILFKVEDPSKDAEVRARAEDVLKRVKAGGDFAELAKKYSQDEGSAQQGGNLGPFPRGQMVKEFEDVAFALQPGQVSDLVKTEFGYHIIKVLRHEIPDLESSRPALVRGVQINKASDLAKRKAAEAMSLVDKLKDLDAIAKALNVPAEILETGFFNRASDPTNLNISKSMITAVFELKEINAIAKPVDVPSGYAIAQLLETKLPKPPDFAQSREAIARDYTDVKAEELVKAEAQKLSEEATRLGDLDKAGKAMKLTVINTQPFKRDASPAPEIANTEDFNNAAFDLPVGGVSAPLNVKGTDQIAVLQVASRTPFDEAAYAKKRYAIRQSLGGNWRDAYFQAYIQRITSDMEKAGKIRINTSVMNQVTNPGS